MSLYLYRCFIISIKWLYSSLKHWYLAWNLGNTCIFIQMLKDKDLIVLWNLLLKKTQMKSSEETSCDESTQRVVLYISCGLGLSPKASHISVAWSQVRNNVLKNHESFFICTVHWKIPSRNLDGKTWFLRSVLHHLIQQTFHPPCT